MHPAGQLNLNRASQAELEALPSIGPVTATRILEHRETRGEFVNLQQLVDLKLIHRGQFDAIRDLVTFEQINYTPSPIALIISSVPRVVGQKVSIPRVL